MLAGKTVVMYKSGIHVWLGSFGRIQAGIAKYVYKLDVRSKKERCERKRSSTYS